MGTTNETTPNPAQTGAANQTTNISADFSQGAAFLQVLERIEAMAQRQGSAQ